MGDKFISSNTLKFYVKVKQMNERFPFQGKIEKYKNRYIENDDFNIGLRERNYAKNHPDEKTSNVSSNAGRQRGHYLKHKKRQLEQFYNDHPLIDLYDHPQIIRLEIEENIATLIDGFRKHLFDSVNGNSISILYGSYASKNQKPGSDIDLMFSCDSITFDLYKKYLFPVIKIFLEDLHELLGAKRDDEVPSSSKLLVEYSTMQKASSADVFYEKNNYNEKEYKLANVIPLRKFEKKNIRKGDGARFDKEFLSSDYLRLRLIFNILTTPNKISGNFYFKEFLEKNAKISLIKLAKDLQSQLGKNGKLDVSVLERRSNDEFGEMWLGYKFERKGVKEKLERLLTESKDDEKFDY